MLSFDDALGEILSKSKTIGVQETPVGAQALGLYLAQPVIAHLTQPPFNASAMDGYAVRSAEVTDDHSLTVVGTSQAGSAFDGTLLKNQCVRIFTGAPVPAETDAVIMQEQAERNENQVSFSTVPKSGQNIRLAGQDFAKDKELLGIGQVLTPAAIALAAAAGNANVSTYIKPKLAMLATGDELVRAGETVGPDQIIASNGYGLGALFAPLCREVVDLGIAADNTETLTQHLREALESDADVIVTSGGASVGDHDLVQPVLKSLGVDIGFWKIAMRPGKPLMFGTYGKKLIIGLPGNPVSAMVTATLFVVPALKAIAGAGDPHHKILRLPLAGLLGQNGPRRHFLRAHMVSTESGTKVLPFSQTDSAHLSSLAVAHALIIHPENGDEMQVGDIVDVIQLATF